ncbi:MAG: TIGR03643 family protein [Bacteroidota bacterium]
MHNKEISEIIEMAWTDKVSFDDIRALTGLSEADTISIMRRNLKPSSFRMWRKRVSGRTTKHRKINSALRG